MNIQTISNRLISFNRTFMELKFFKDIAYRRFSFVLIVPLWN